jgi:tRNA(Ile)-lysidine synthase
LHRCVKRLHPSLQPVRLEQRFEETVAHYDLIVRGESVLVAVSGGPDSVALLHLLAERAAAWQLRLGVAHLDHGLREESARDADFIRQLAENLALPLHTERVDVRDLQRRWHLSIEAAGRKARYQFFQETVDRHGFNKVALAHHADDNAETLLLNLLRGSGRLGLGGMPPMRAGCFIRPLIRADRADVLDYLRRRNLSALADPSNRDNDFLRNRIRNQLIPLLEREYQRGVRAVLHRSAEALRDEEEWIETQIQPLYEQAVVACPPGQLILDAGALRGFASAIQRRVVRAGLRFVKGDLRRIAFVHIEGILALVHRPGNGGPLHLPGGLRVQRRGGTLMIGRGDSGLAGENPSAAGIDYSYQMDRCGVVTVAETGVTIALTAIEQEPADPTAAGPLTVFLDAAAVEFPVTIRNFRPGDRFAPLGMDGTQKLKKFFIDHKVPRDQRRRCPLLLSRERILWVAGHRISREASLNRQTRQVLKAELILAD